MENNIYEATNIRFTGNAQNGTLMFDVEKNGQLLYNQSVTGEFYVNKYDVNNPFIEHTEYLPEEEGEPTPLVITYLI